MFKRFAAFAFLGVIALIFSGCNGDFGVAGITECGEISENPVSTSEDNWGISSTTEVSEDTSEDLHYCGAYDSRYDFKHYIVYASIDSGLIKTVGEDKFAVFEEMFKGTHQFSTGGFCEYFGIDKETYISFTARYDSLRDIRPNFDGSMDMVLNGEKNSTEYANSLMIVYEFLYDAHFGDYANASAFLVPDFDPEKTGDVIIVPAECKKHTIFYHTIYYKLAEYVGEEGMSEFVNKYGNTEEFNVLNFLEYFQISRTQFEQLISEKRFPYNPKYLYGTEDMQQKYFEIHPIDMKEFYAKAGLNVATGK